LIDGVSVAKSVVDEVRVINQQSAQSAVRFGSVGLVLGATVDLSSLGVSNINRGLELHKTPILAPGFGAQGAKLSESKAIFGEDSDSVIYSISRSALRNGLTHLKQTIEKDKEELLVALSK
jgi:orotidine-5'-phosphate decarboxylase